MTGERSLVKPIVDSLRVDLGADIREIINRTPEAVVHGVSVTSQHIEKDGADYDFIRIDYRQRQRVIASRMIASILAGQRTELAYWCEDAPDKKLSVHKGAGAIVIASPAQEVHGIFRLDPRVTPEVVLPAGSFYTFEADQHASEGLVVSGFYDPPVESWGDLEVVTPRGAITIAVPGEGEIEVPKDFVDRYAI